MRKFLTVLFILTLSTVGDGSAHVGSPGIVFEGTAGPYKLLVSIDPPDVIPGTAKVQVFVERGNVTEVLLRPIYWRAGGDGSPPADPASPVIDYPNQFQGMVWFMSQGSASLEIEVRGEEGEGSTVIPVTAVSTAQKEMDASLGWVLGILGLLLVILMSTIIGASVSDGILPAGDKGTSLGKKRLKGATISLALLALILYGGWTWWNSWADDYRQYMYKPMKASSELVAADSSMKLRFSVNPAFMETRGAYNDLKYLTADHGKIMHMFAMREGSLDGFAHLHPRRIDSITFEADWPPLPDGRYFIFSDIVWHTGYQETIADTLVVNSSMPDSLWNPVDIDDTYILSNPFNGTEALPGGDIIVCGKPGVRTPLPDGSTAIWEHDSSEPLTAGQLYPMTFAILDPDGSPAELEPYMGMMGHMVVMKTDGSVYIHLHPVGSYSSVGQEIMTGRLGKAGQPSMADPATYMDSVDQEVQRILAMDPAERDQFLYEQMDHSEDEDSLHAGHSVVSFPYVFPESGDYRIWIQMKRNGRVLNTAFDAHVTD